MKFKTDRIEYEFAILATVNYRLFQIAQDFERESRSAFNIEPTLTSIYRSPAENVALYAPKPQPDFRPHTFWEAFDVRSSVYSDEQIQHLVNYLNSNYRVFDGQHVCSLYHMIPGGAYHFHVQSESTAVI